MGGLVVLLGNILCSWEVQACVGVSIDEALCQHGIRHMLDALLGCLLAYAPAAAASLKIGDLLRGVL